MRGRSDAWQQVSPVALEPKDSRVLHTGSMGFVGSFLNQALMVKEARTRVKPKVLVAATSRWFTTARLAIALANAGCTVEAVCPPGHPLGNTSAVQQTHNYNGLAPLMSFADAIATSKPDFLLPGDDPATWHLHELYIRERLNGKGGSPICVLIERSLGSPESFPVVSSRASFMTLAQEECIRVPKTEVVTNIESLRDWVSRMGFPTVLKANGTSGGVGVRIVHTLEQAERAFLELESPPVLARAAKRALVDKDKTLIWPFLLRRRSVVNAQSFITGREGTSAIACWRGTVLAGLYFEVLKKANSAGIATVVRLIENAQMSVAVERMVRRLNLSGVHGFDFLLEAHTGNAYLIEINPRATQVGHLTLGPGRDLPAALHAVLAGKAVESAPKVTDNDTIVLFPHEWIRNPTSPYLRSGYHDVPWEEPELLHACIGRFRKQSPWYYQQNWVQVFSTFRLRASVTAPRNAPAARLADFPSERARGQSHDSGFPIPPVDSLGCALDSFYDSGGRRVACSPDGFNTNIPSPDGTAAASEHTSGHLLQGCHIQSQTWGNVGEPLRIMKFGGTSVGDASCIRKVVDIIRAASRASNLVVVVSAMSGVTNKLIEAAAQSEAGDWEAVSAIFAQLRRQHETAASALIHSAAERNCIDRKIREFFQEGERLCQGTMLLREVTLRARDSISSLGERLSAPIVAAALVQCGVASEAIEATELVLTDSQHGAADPRMDLTRQRCEARLRPLLRRGTVPVVTGFIGATAEGVLTTLGRGGSDYSATILGAAVGASEVIIWTDVDGLLTADPRLVPNACIIPEISYREASELAYFGAKVLHPKTLRAVIPCGIPVWIRNTFAPERRGTKITPSGPPNDGGVKALTAISDIALVAVGGSGVGGVPDVLGRTLAATAAVPADVLLIHQSSSRDDICVVISSAFANRTVEALREEFTHDLAHEATEHIRVDSTVAIVTVVGQNMRAIPGIIGRAFGALGRENINIIAIAQGSSECNISFVVAEKDAQAALITAHREFQLGTPQPFSVSGTGARPASWYFESGGQSAVAD